MKQNSNLTAIISTRNRANILSFTLKALYAFKSNNGIPDEILIVNDASKDETDKVIKKSFGCANLINLPERVGVPGARNIGAKKATNDFLLFLDDDGIPSFSHIPRLLNLIKSQPKLVAIGFNLVAIKEDIDKVARRELGAFKTPDSISLEDTYTFPGGASLVSKKEFIKAGGYPDHFFYSGEEDDLSARLFSSGYKVAKCRSANYYHFRSSDEIPQGKIDRLKKDYYYFRNRHLFFWRNFPPTKAFRESLFTTLGGFVRTVFRTRFVPFFFGTVAGLGKVPEILVKKEPTLRGEKFREYEELYLGKKKGFFDRIMELVSDIINKKPNFPFI